MNKATQREYAETFRDLHVTRGDPLVLPNAWDCASALIFEAEGFPVVGTTSAGIAASHGVPDGEQLSLDEMLAAVERIAHAVDLPVSADMEAGYGDSPDAVAETVRRTIEAGAIGINLEDGTDGPNGPLLDMDVHVSKIRAARAAANDEDIPLLINGRTDVFWRDVGEDTTQVGRAAERCNAYLDAGSDCVFVPGVTTSETIGALVDAIDGPLNVLGGPGAPSISALGELGVARVSVGSGPVRATLADLRRVADELLNDGDFDTMADAIPYPDLNDLLEIAQQRQVD